MSRSTEILLVTLLLGGLAACSRDRAEPSREKLVLRLAERLDDARLTRSGMPRASDETLFLESFDGEPATSWFSLASLASDDSQAGIPLPENHWLADEPASNRVLGLPVGHQGGVTFVPLPPSGSYLVTVRYREVRQRKHHAPGLSVLALEGEVGNGPLPPRRAAELFRTRGWQTERAEVPVSREDGWSELLVLLGPNNRRGSLAVTLIPGADTLFDDLTVRRLSPLEEVQLTDVGEEFADNPQGIRHKVSLRDSVRDALLLESGSRLTVPVRLPASEPSLELALGVKGATPSSRVEFVVSIDDRPILTEVLSVDPEQREAPFQDHRIALDEWAGKDVELGFAVRSPDREGGIADLGVIGHPTLLSTGSEQNDAPPSSPNLVLISLDTLRADRLSCYGYERNTSPRLDALAAEGVRFARVHSPTSYTLPTHVSILSGQHPLVHGVRFRQMAIDTARTPLLARELREQGLLTVAFTASGYVDPEFGFDCGFDRYDVTDPGAPDTRVERRRLTHQPDRPTDPRERMDGIARWIEGHHAQPFFLFVHTYLVHSYGPRREWLERIGGDPGLGTWPDLEEGIQEFTADEAGRKHLSDLYDATLLQADEVVVGTVLDALTRAGLDQRTIVCVVADHGEEFWEHGEQGHGMTLFGEQLLVPWILRAPGGPVGTVVDQDVSLEVIAPTLRDLLGLPPHPQATGRAFDLDARPGSTPWFSGDANPYVLDLWSDRKKIEGVVSADWKLLVERADEQTTTFLFDLGGDPDEQVNLAESRPDMVKRMQRFLDGSAAALVRRRQELFGDDTSQHTLSDQLKDRLEGLGYLGK